jgi:hypothetical protein
MGQEYYLKEWISINEKDLSTQSPQTPKGSWFQEPHEDGRRPQGLERPTQEGPL